jgi:E3 ubiquitin-protein ligase RNF38/44
MAQSSSHYALLIFVIVVLSILVTTFIFITYLIFVTKCCLNWHPLRWISILPPPQNEEPFIAFSPRIWTRGVDESVIQEIPTFQFTKGEGDDDNHQSVKGCVVCLNSFQEQDMLKVLPNCSHHFHLDCINIWLQTNANCPLCRTSISGNTQFPMNRIIAAPSSSPQDSQLLSNMGSDEDFVVIELWGDGENRGTRSQIQQERNESRERLETLSRTHSTTRKAEEEMKVVQLKPRKCHRGSIMGDECIDVRKKDDQFSIQPIRRSFSLDSASDRKAYVDVQNIIQQNNRHQNEDCGINSEGCSYEDCNRGSNKGRRSFFPFRYGRV